MTVLLVEDDELQRDALVHVLQASGYTVAEAANGEQALSALRGGLCPCIIVLDMLMPVMSGWDFLRERNQDPRLLAIPTIILTALAGKALADALPNVPAVLRKPVDPERLCQVVAAHC